MVNAYDKAWQQVCDGLGLILVSGHIDPITERTVLRVKRNERDEPAMVLVTAHDSDARGYVDAVIRALRDFADDTAAPGSGGELLLSALIRVAEAAAVARLYYGMAGMGPGYELIRPKMIALQDAIDAAKQHGFDFDPWSVVNDR